MQKRFSGDVALNGEKKCGQGIKMTSRILKYRQGYSHSDEQPFLASKTPSFDGWMDNGRTATSVQQIMSASPRRDTFEAKAKRARRFVSWRVGWPYQATHLG